MAKLNEMQVLEILGSEDKGVRLAEKYEVSTTTISLIRSHKNWKYLHEELPNVTKT